MTLAQFAHAWLERQGMIDTDSVFDAQIGRNVLRLIHHLEQDVCSLKDVLLLFAIVTNMYKAYDDAQSDIWQAYRREERRRKAS